MRVRAVLGTSELDRRLAAGEPPDADRALASRARTLVRPRRRRALGVGLMRVVQAAEGTPRKVTAVPLDVEQIRAARRELVALADRLLDLDAPVCAQAAAQVHLLLTDPHSPVFVAGEVRSHAQAALRCCESASPG